MGLGWDKMNGEKISLQKFHSTVSKMTSMTFTLFNRPIEQITDSIIKNDGHLPIKKQ